HRLLLSPTLFPYTTLFRARPCPGRGGRGDAAAAPARAHGRGNSGVAGRLPPCLRARCTPPGAGRARGGGDASRTGQPRRGGDGRGGRRPPVADPAAGGQWRRSAHGGAGSVARRAAATPRAGLRQVSPVPAAAARAARARNGRTAAPPWTSGRCNGT